MKLCRLPALLGFRPVAINSLILRFPRFSTFINKNFLWENTSFAHIYLFIGIFIYISLDSETFHSMGGPPIVSPFIIIFSNNNKLLLLFPTLAIGNPFRILDIYSVELSQPPFFLDILWAQFPQGLLIPGEVTYCIITGITK